MNSVFPSVAIGRIQPSADAEVGEDTHNDLEYLSMFQLCKIPAYDGCEYPACQYSKSADISTYTVQIVSCIAYLTLFILVMVKLVKLRKALIWGVSLLIYTFLSFFRAFTHVITVYSCFPPIVMHLLFVLPVAFLLVVFANVVSSWMAIVSGKNGRKNGLILMIVMCSSLGVVVIVLLAFQINYTVNDNLGLRLANSGQTNVAIASLYFVYIILFLVIGSLLVSKAKKITGALADSIDPDIWKVLKRISICSIVASVCFGIYGGLMVWEGVNLIKTYAFVYSVMGEYTATWWLELIYIVLQTTPAAMLLVITHQSKGGESGKALMCKEELDQDDDSMV